MTFNTPITRIAGAAATATIVGALAIGAAAPASAAPLDTPGSSASVSARASAFTPTPGIDGLRVEGGRTYLVGTGVPSGFVSVDNGRMGRFNQIDEDGTWKIDVTSWPFGTLVVQQAQNGVRSAEVWWTVNDGPVAPGTGSPIPPVTVATPVVEGVRSEGGKRLLVGTGIPGASITAELSSSGGTMILVDGDGTWTVDVTRAAFPVVSLWQAHDGARSASVYYSIKG